MEKINLLENKIALVTSAASGIGKEIALEFAREGAIVIIADINQEKSAQTLKEVKLLSPTSLSIPTDIASEKQLDNLISKIKEAFGGIDVLVNNAGIGLKGTPLEVSRENWDKVIETNLSGNFFLTQKTAQLMIKNKTSGKIIFITSIYQDIPSRHAQYSSTKAALKMVVKEFALELAPYNIRVNGIAPGAIKSREEMDENYAPTPLYGKKGGTLDIARAALVLASDYFTNYVTGTVFRVDGGLSLVL